MIVDGFVMTSIFKKCQSLNKCVVAGKNNTAKTSTDLADLP